MRIEGDTGGFSEPKVISHSEKVQPGKMNQTCKMLSFRQE